MPLLLRRRDAQCVEMLDCTDCDPETARTTYRQFARINAVGSRFRSVYRRWLRPCMAVDPAGRYTLLDIGSGGGDIAVALARWARADGFALEVTGIDLNPRALAYAAARETPSGVAFSGEAVEALLERGERFDFVISNHLLHHLEDDELPAMLDAASRLVRRCAVMADARRSDAAYLLFAAFASVFLRGSYHRHDGLASLRRAYTPVELAHAAPPGWLLERLFPFRLMLVSEPEAIVRRRR